MATGIKDKVAILGMGCTTFGERWDVGSEQLLAEAFAEALADAGIERKQVQAAWFGSALDQVNVGGSAIPLSTALRLGGMPVTRVENMCATGTEALRGATYAVASGAVDIALAIGRGETQRHWLRRFADFDQGNVERPLAALLLSAGWLRAARRRIRRALSHQPKGSEDRDGARFVEEPPKRRQESESTSAQGGEHGCDPRCADHR